MSTALQDWLEWSEQGSYTVLPYIESWETPGFDKPYLLSWSKAWQESSPYAFVLESGKAGRYTYFGIKPASVIYGYETEAHIGYSHSSHANVYEREYEDKRIEDTMQWTIEQGKPLSLLRSFMSSYRSPRVEGAPKFLGGCVGYLSYDFARTIEKLPNKAKKDIDIPDYYFMRCNELWVYDQELSIVYSIVHAEITGQETVKELEHVYNATKKKALHMKQQWKAWIEDEAVRGEQEAVRDSMQQHIDSESLHIDIEAIADLSSPTSKQQFMDAVKRIQDYIAAGDVFQVNLSQRQSKAIHIKPQQLYEWLRLFNPSPYMGYFSTPELQLVSASPELLVEVINGKLATRPIAGTRRRGRTEEEEARFVQELLSNEKEKAEHIMLVDLERNDLGRVSKYGTVKVKELMVIERYSHVMHLVSQIEGELQQGKDCYDVIAATFPGGTITGAPKIRTMEIIDELEPVRRGPYTGSLGWIDYNGDMELNIIIRTMLIKDHQAYIQAGAGIVIDSDPKREYYESLSKAKALWKAIQYGETYISD